MPAPTSAVPLRRPIGPWVGLMAVLLLVAGVMTSGVQRLHQNALKVERDRLAHQTKNLAFVDGERQVVDGGQIAESFRQSLGSDGVHGKGLGIGD